MKIILIRHAEPDGDVYKMNVSGGEYKLYSSPDSFAVRSADIMWEGEDYIRTDLLREADRTEETETKESAASRAREFIDMIEEEGFDTIAISHEHFLKLLFKELRRRRYQIKRTNIFKVDYLEKAVATKTRDHCGRCTQNCLLSNPACDIGRDMAIREKKR